MLRLKPFFKVKFRSVVLGCLLYRNRHNQFVVAYQSRYRYSGPARSWSAPGPRTPNAASGCNTVFPRDTVCLRNMSINTLHKGDNDDDNNNLISVLAILGLSLGCYGGSSPRTEYDDGQLVSQVTRSV